MKISTILLYVLIMIHGIAPSPSFGDDPPGFVLDMEAAWNPPPKRESFLPAWLPVPDKDPLPFNDMFGGSGDFTVFGAEIYQNDFCSIGGGAGMGVEEMCFCYIKFDIPETISKIEELCSDLFD